MVLVFDPVEAGGKQMFCFIRFCSAHFLFLAGGALLVFLDIVQVDEIGLAGAFLSQVLLEVLLLVEATFQFTQIFIFVDV